jgi:hypothetical protein
MLKSLFPLILGLFFLGCSNANEMQAKTNKMSETTERMDNKMSDTNNNIGEVLRVSKNALRLVRPSSAAEARNIALSLMDYASTLSSKISYAAKYFHAFEFQFWTSEFDTRTHREDLKGQAAEEFFKEIRQFMVKPLTPLAGEEAGLYALSATLHEKEFFQIQGAKEAGIPETSMLDIIEEGLRSKELVNGGRLMGRQIPVAVSTVLQNEERAVQILKSRQNVLLLLALSEAWDMGERRAALVWNAIWAEFAYWVTFANIQLKLETKNLVQIQWQNRYLRGSLRVRDLLLDLGYNADLESGKLKLDLPYVYGKINPVSNQSAYLNMNPLIKREILTYGRLLRLVRMSDAEFKRVASAEYACVELDCTK